MAPFQRVVGYAPPGVTTLGLGMLGAVFRSRPGLTSFDVTVCGDRVGALSTDLGTALQLDRDLSALATADLVLLLPGEPAGDPSAALVDGVRAAYRRGAIVAA